MKSGASDPFADDAAPVDERDEQEASESASPSTDELNESEDPTHDVGDDDAVDRTNDDGDGGAPNAESPVDESETESEPTISKADLPLLLRRDTVKAERENVHQLFVQNDTDTKARQAENELSERLDTDVYRLDAREAIYLAGMRNLADAEEILVGWGYNF